MNRTEDHNDLEREDREALLLAIELQHRAQGAQALERRKSAVLEETHSVAVELGAEAFLPEARRQLQERNAGAIRESAEQTRRRRAAVAVAAGAGVVLLLFASFLATGDSPSSPVANAAPPIASVGTVAPAVVAPVVTTGGAATERVRALHMAAEQVGWRTELADIQRRLTVEAPAECREKWGAGGDCYVSGRMMTALQWDEEQAALRLRSTQLRRNLEAAVGR